MLTQSQLTTLRNDIVANSGPGGEFENVPNTPDGNEQIAQAYNAAAVPDYYVWKKYVTEDEFTMTTSNDGTTEREFQWSGVGGFIDRSVGEQTAWGRLFRSGSVNPTQKNTRQAFADIFSGGQTAAATNRAHMLALSYRLALRVEKLFSVQATGPGNNGANARGDRTNPDALTHEGTITRSDVEQARNIQ